MDTISLIFSIIGTLVGVVGLIVTIKTWKNTANIEKAIIKEKIKKFYPQKHKEFTSSINIAINSLRDGGRKYYIIRDLTRSCRSIQAFNDNWDNNQKALVNNFLKFLEKIPNQDINDKTQEEILKKLYKIQPQLERIGKLNGIR